MIPDEGTTGAGAPSSIEHGTGPDSRNAAGCTMDNTIVIGL